MAWLIPFSSLTPAQQDAVQMDTRSHKAIIGGPGAGNRPPDGARSARPDAGCPPSGPRGGGVRPPAVPRRARSRPAAGLWRAPPRTGGARRRSVGRRPAPARRKERSPWAEDQSGSQAPSQVCVTVATGVTGGPPAVGRIRPGGRPPASSGPRARWRRRMCSCSSTRGSRARRGRTSMAAPSRRRMCSSS